MFDDVEMFFAVWQADWPTAIGILLASLVLLFLGSLAKEMGERAANPILKLSNEAAKSLRVSWKFSVACMLLVTLLLFGWVNRDPCSRLDPQSNMSEVLECTE